MILFQNILNGNLSKRDPQIPQSEFVIIREDNTHLIYSNDWFSSFTRITTNSIKAVGHNGTTCGWYIEGSSETALTFHYTIDSGTTWNTTTAPYYSRWASSSDDGYYWLLGGNTNQGANYFHKRCIGGVWDSTPSSIYYSNYGGRYSQISRDGQLAVVTNRSKGIAYNFNYLDYSSWYSGVYINTLGYHIPMAHDLSCWITASKQWNAQSVFNLSTNFTTPLTVSNVSPVKPYAFMGGIIGFTDDTNKIHYRYNSALSQWEVLDNMDVVIGTDDNHLFEFKINVVTGAGTCNGYAISNVLYNCFYVSRDGASVIFVDSINYKLWISNDFGLSWTDKTPSGSYLSSLASMKAQWNHSLF